MEARILLENNMESMVQEIRREDPGIGAYKLFLMLKDIYGKGCSAVIVSTSFSIRSILCFRLKNADIRQTQITIIVSIKIR